MNNLTIAGVIGRDAELRRTGDGDPVAGFPVGVSNGKDKDGNWRDSTWFDCSLWGKRAEALAPYLLKGGKVVVSGQVSARAHEGKAYLQIRVAELTMQGGVDVARVEQTERPKAAKRDHAADYGFDEEMEVPF
jgi:single-strand DNA-binding protein